MTPRQSEMLACFQRYALANPGRSPTYKELADANRTSRSAAHYMVQKLIGAGHIVDRGGMRGLVLAHNHVYETWVRTQADGCDVVRCNCGHEVAVRIGTRHAPA